MEYIKKEKLIEGQIYKASNESLTFIMKATKDLNNVVNIPSYNELMKNGNFNGSYLTFINATPEEKHWLNTCIKLDKFITFEEAMKTFIPEYVECTLQQKYSDYKLGVIYKIRTYGYIGDGYAHYSCNLERFKPSTKEAYDAQFVVKEPEFVLPEKWYITVQDREKEIEYYRKYFIKHSYIYDKGYVYGVHNNKQTSGEKYGQEITFEQFKKYVLKEETVVEEVKVIEPLPQFKVIETIETITKVENNEGNQFFIGDVVKSDKNTVYNIIGFKYNVDKTDILALATELPAIGISINKIEHYIEPKVEVKEETLLEKAKRLYPIGTTISNYNLGKGCVFKTNSDDFYESNGDILVKCPGSGNYTIYCNNEWAKIIK